MMYFAPSRRRRLLIDHLLIISTCFIGFISAKIGMRKPLLESLSYLNDLSFDPDAKIHLSLKQTQLLIDTLWTRAGCGRELDPVLCKKCLQATELFDIIGANVSIGLGDNDFEKASVILLYHMENGICKMPDEIIVTYGYVDYLYDLVTTTQSQLDVTAIDIGNIKRIPAPPARVQSFNNLPVDLRFVEEQLDYILHLISQTYTATTHYQCFTAADVFEDAHIEPNEEAHATDIERISAVVISNILRGHCIGVSRLVSPDEFIRSVFEDYGTFGTILKPDFSKLLHDLGIGSEKFGHALSASHDTWEETTMMLRKRRRRAPSHERIDDMHDSHGAIEHSGCFTEDELFNIFDIQESVTVEKFRDMCPALIQQISEKSCERSLEEYMMHQSGLIYGWGTLAVLLVTLGSMIGIVVVPLAGAKVYTGIMHLLVALAVSTLSGDALLHLLPEAMGIHMHGGDRPATPQEILSKVILVVGAIYAFFLFERLMIVCLGKAPLTNPVSSMNKLGELEVEDQYDPKKFQAGNSFDVVDTIDDMQDFNDFDHLERYRQPEPESKPDDVCIDIELADKTLVHKTDNGENGLTDTLECRILEESAKAVGRTSTSFGFLRGMKSTSVLVLIGGAIHNFADGIAIGVGFTLDGFVGSSITIAVFCHELPHEIGDFAVLLKHGMSFRTAFFWSFVSNLFAFIGLYAGIALGYNQSVHQWIFAGTAGLFLYISLVDLMPEITHDPNGFKLSAFFMHNVGLVLGWTMMMVLAYFEEGTLRRARAA